MKYFSGFFQLLGLLVIAIILVVLAITHARGAEAEADYCESRVDVALVLALDYSNSMDNDGNIELQRMGYVEAFRHEDVQNAILFGGCRRIAATVLTWSEKLGQDQAVSWRVLKDRESIEKFARALETLETVVYRNSTSIAGAIERSVETFNYLLYTPERKVIDISSNGADDSRGMERQQKYDEGQWTDYLKEARVLAMSEEITVNAIVLPPEEYEYDDRNIDLVEYFYTEVITPGGFVIPAESREQFAEALRWKLIQEIAGR